MKVRLLLYRLGSECGGPLTDEFGQSAPSGRGEKGTRVLAAETPHAFSKIKNIDSRIEKRSNRYKGGKKPSRSI